MEVWIAVEDDREAEADAADRILGVFADPEDGKAACLPQFRLREDDEAELDWHQDDLGDWYADPDDWTSYTARKYEVH